MFLKPRTLFSALLGISLLLVPLLRAQPAVATRPFRITSLTSDFSVKGDVVGTCHIFANHIELHISRAHLVMDDKLPHAQRRHVTGIQYGLTRLIDGRQWDIISRSQLSPMDDVMSPGQQRDLGGGYVVTIPFQNGVYLPEHWLTLQINLKLPPTKTNPRGIGFTYAHSPRTVFKIEE